MATIKRSLSSKTNDNGRSEILLRLCLTKNNKLRIKSGIFVAATRFKDGNFIKPRFNQNEITELRETEDKLLALERFLISLSETKPGDEISKEYIEEAMEHWRNPEKYEPEEKEEVRLHFDEIIEKFLAHKQLSISRVRHYHVMRRSFHRFELYRQKTENPDYKFSFYDCTTEDIYAFESFLIAEPELYEKYPEIYVNYPSQTNKMHKTKKPKPRGNNYLAAFIKRVKAVFHWCHSQGIVENNPFLRYKATFTEQYGTPIYINDEAVMKLVDFNFNNKHLDTQRDIFIFQCSIGCRVGDLMSMMPSNVVNDAIEYIADKTKAERPRTIRVPLSPLAKALIKKYEGADSEGRLFPFITQQKYNKAIKEIFKAAELTHAVTRLNPTTGMQEQVPIDQIATSHMARRTFVGNLYKKVQDPNLVGSLSGHAEGSKAFTRYRDIDEDMKKDVIAKIGYGNIDSNIK